MDTHVTASSGARAARHAAGLPQADDMQLRALRCGSISREGALSHAVFLRPCAAVHGLYPVERVDSWSPRTRMVAKARKLACDWTHRTVIAASRSEWGELMAAVGHP